jgi:hypothetical protein
MSWQEALFYSVAAICATVFLVKLVNRIADLMD